MHINCDRYIAMMIITTIPPKSINMIILKTLKRYVAKEFS